MYGKTFESMYEGSMIGAGINVFAVWNYIITKGRRGVIEINPKLLAFTLGGTELEVVSALEFLQQPDSESRSKLEEGRRLIKEGQFQYRIVNWDYYDKIKNEIERRDYNRVRQNKHRNKDKIILESKSTIASSLLKSCESIYKEYPKKVGKPAALKAIQKAVAEFSEAVILDRTRAYAIARKGEDQQFTPNPATFFNQQRFNDDPTTWKSNHETHKPNPPQRIDRSIGTTNEGIASNYKGIKSAGVGGLVRADDPPRPAA